MGKAAISAHDIATRFWGDRTGAVAVALAVLLPVLIGFAGIGIEVGLWYAIQRQNQSAADAAAISAALEYAVQFEQPGMPTDPVGAATKAAGYNLFSNANCSASGTTNCTLYPCYNFTVGGACNTSSSNGTPLNAVQVVLTQPLNTTFANLVTAIWGPNLNTVSITTSAIAALRMLPGGQTCLLAVGGGITFWASATATLNLLNCSLASLSTSGNSIQLSSSANLTINAAAVATAGNIAGSSAALPPYTFTNFPLQDPYKGVTITKPTGACQQQDPNLTTLRPDVFYCGLTFTGTIPVMLQSGVYYIDGNFTITGGASVTGSGVTIVLTNVTQAGAGIDIACGATVSLTAAGAGPLQGLLFFQDPTAVTSSTNIITTGCGTSNVTLNGAIYTPAGKDILQGNIKGCAEFIAQSFAFGGDFALDNTGCSVSGITLNQAQIQQVYLAM